jgi:hypothetical protein
VNWDILSCFRDKTALQPYTIHLVSATSAHLSRGLADHEWFQGGQLNRGQKRKDDWEWFKVYNREKTAEAELKSITL